MRFPIDLASAQRRHPERVASILAEQRESRSVYRDVPAADLHWSYEVAMQVVHRPSGQVIAGRIQPPPPFVPAATAEERQQRILALALAQIDHAIVSLQARQRQTRWVRRLTPDEFPDELLQHYVALADTAERERERVARLTPDERRAEEAAALRELRGMPGFVELRRPPRRPRSR